MVIVVGPFYSCIQPGHFLQKPGAGYHRAERSVAVGLLQLGLPTQPRNPKCLCLLGYAKLI